MFQSKLSSANYDTKLTKKVITYGTGSDYVENYLQKYLTIEEKVELLRTIHRMW